MARMPDPHSATGQFFINHKDNVGLDHKDKSDAGFGYCVFGKVIEGMDIVDKIGAVKVDPMSSKPVEAVKILSLRREKK